MQLWNLSSSFTRPNNTTAYAANQLVANSTTAGSVVPLSWQLGNRFPQGQFRLVRARLTKSTIQVANAQFRLHLYQAPPTVANGDGAAWSSSNAADYLGSVDLPGTGTMTAFTDGAAAVGALPAGSEMLVRLAQDGTVYGLLMALAAYTPPANEVFTAILETLEAY